MIFTETELSGAFIIDLERREDDRGYFARAFCQTRVRGARSEAGHRAGECRLQPDRRDAPRDALPVPAGCGDEGRSVHARCDRRHHRRPEAGEPDVSCSTSPFTSTRRTGGALYVPERFAHGYQTLVDETETSYLVGEFYTPEAEGGLRHRRSSPRAQLAAAGDGDLREGRVLGAARRDRAGAAAAHGAARVIIVDTALRAREAEGRPIRVGIVGAGFMGRGLTNQIVNSVPGMQRRRYLEPASGAGGRRLSLRRGRAGRASTRRRGSRMSRAAAERP